MGGPCGAGWAASHVICSQYDLYRDVLWDLLGIWAALSGAESMLLSSLWIMLSSIFLVSFVVVPPIISPLHPNEVQELYARSLNSLLDLSVSVDDIDILWSERQQWVDLGFVIIYKWRSFAFYRDYLCCQLVIYKGITSSPFFLVDGISFSSFSIDCTTFGVVANGNLRFLQYSLMSDFVQAFESDLIVVNFRSLSVHIYS